MMKIKYNNGIEERDIEVKNFYEDVAKLLVKEDVENGKRVIEINTMYGNAVYEVRNRKDGYLKIRELLNTMPDEYADEGLKPCYLFGKFVSAEKHNFYEITPCKTDVTVKYGRKGDKDSMFSDPRTDSIPKRMYWIKKYEKLANGYADSEQLNFTLRKKMLS